HKETSMKLSMKTAAFALAISALPALAQFEGVIDMKMEGSSAAPMSGTGRTYVTKGAWRTEMEMTSEKMKTDPEAVKALGGKAAFKMVMLGKLSEPGISYMINDVAKTYSRLDAAEMAKNLPKDKDRKWTVKRLGKDHVAGLACENVKATEEGKKSEWELCVTKDIPSGEWVRAMQRQQRGSQGLWMKALQDAGIDGYPVRMVMRESASGPVTMRMEATKVERRSLPGSLFEIPPGYKETGMMGMFVQTPEQAKQMEDAQKQLNEAMKNMTPEQRKQMEEMMKKMGQQKQ
ncbi:MAG TPA: DUF4412 domain-containing protein, partial [Thermoanaerobaculia bacterium]|nr:DUF4412 domain-containing protein [Thermoanaerobaculia bacterium]